jgi:methionyl-tRNA formyltransferase
MQVKAQDLKIVFAGTPEIAHIVLQKLVEHKHNIAAVLTKPDSPQGRGQKLTPSIVKQYAIEQKIRVYEPVSFKQDVTIIEQLKQLQPDIMIVVAYGLILPSVVLAIPKLGCVNIHVSLLPRFRGAAPINRAILAGDKVSGVTLIQMDAGLDTGDILLQQQVSIADQDTALDLHDKLAHLGAKMIIEYLDNYSQIKPKPQSSEDVSYAPKIEKSEALINWHEEAFIIERKIRGFNPAPGCYSFLEQKLIKFWESSIGENTSCNVVGQIVQVNHDNFVVCCGKGTTLVVKKMQESGKPRQDVANYILGHKNLLGKCFHNLPKN